MKYTQLQKLLHIDLVDYKEIDGMKLLLRFRIHRELNEESYNELLSIMGGSSIEQDDDRFPLIEIEFDSYIGFSIRNESYTLWDEYELFEGRIFRLYENSRYLDYISLATIASEDYLGLFKHYGVAGLNHIVDIVSTYEPIVRI